VFTPRYNRNTANVGTKYQSISGHQVLFIVVKLVPFSLPMWALPDNSFGTVPWAYENEELHEKKHFV
jgi:hypothetical protein